MHQKPKIETRGEAADKEIHRKYRSKSRNGYIQRACERRIKEINIRKRKRKNI